MTACIGDPVRVCALRTIFAPRVAVVPDGSRAETDGPVPDMPFAEVTR